MSASISFDKYENLITENLKNNITRNIGKIAVKEDFGNFDINYFNIGNGILYTNFKGKFNQDLIFKNNINNQDTTFIKFSANESYSYTIHNDKKTDDLGTNTCIFCTKKENTRSDGFFAKNRYHIYHDIMIISDTFKELCDFQKNSNYFFQIHKRTDTNFKQKQILHQISQIDPLDDPIKSLFLESKIIELLYESLRKKDVTNTLCESDKKTIEKAKKILEKNYEKPPTLAQLAKLCATNEFKIKTSFKKLYNTTAYNYLKDFRLKKAKELLEKNDISINEATVLVGYKSISYFSRAFKEKFGINPKELKKERKCYSIRS